METGRAANGQMVGQEDALDTLVAEYVRKCITLLNNGISSEVSKLIQENKELKERIEYLEYIQNELVSQRTVTGVTERDEKGRIKPYRVKPVFRLNNYPGKYIMHCPEKWMASEFCRFLDANGRTWYGGDSYAEDDMWDFCGESGVWYFFNEGTYNSASDVNPKDFTVLEFTDFLWI